MRSSNEFLELKGIGDITSKLVETKKDIVYPLVFIASKIGFGFTGSDCNGRKSFFNNEVRKEQVA